MAGVSDELGALYVGTPVPRDECANQVALSQSAYMAMAMLHSNSKLLILTIRKSDWRLWVEIIRVCSSAGWLRFLGLLQIVSPLPLAFRQIFPAAAQQAVAGIFLPGVASRSSGQE